MIIGTEFTVHFPHPLYQELFYGLSLRDACFSDLWEPRYENIFERFRLPIARRAGSQAFDSGVKMLEVVPDQFRPKTLAAVGAINPHLSYQAYTNMEPEHSIGLSADFIGALQQLALSDAFSDGEFYENVAKTMGVLEREDICEPLNQIARACPHWKGRLWAAITLWNRCRTTNLIETLTHLQDIAATDSDEHVRTEICVRLSRHKDRKGKDTLFLVQRVLVEGWQVAKQLRPMMDKLLRESISEDHLIEIASNDSAKQQVRERSIWIIAETYQGDVNMRELLARTATGVKEKLNVRIAAVTGLRHFCSEKSLKVFDLLLADENLEIRQAVVSSLQACADLDTSRLFIYALGDADDQVVEEAIVGLSMIAEKAGVLDALFAAHKDQLDSRRRNAFATTARIAIDDSPADHLRAAKELAAYQKHSDPIVRLHVAHGIRHYDAATASEILRELIEGQGADVRKMAEALAVELGMLDP